LSEELSEQLLEVCKYVEFRNFDPLDGRFFWTPMPGFQDRVIIPFYSQGRTVGYTGRKVKDGKPKYLTESQSGYVFNLDKQTYDKKVLIVVEGQFDALAIDGAAIMTNQPNETQIARINALGKQVIVVPDRDRAGSRMISAAIDNQWSVSFPMWGDDIKDVADAVKKYGKLYTLTTILHYCENSQLKIKLMKKKLDLIHE
jgi:DNA primase